MKRKKNLYIVLIFSSKLSTYLIIGSSFTCSDVRVSLAKYQDIRMYQQIVDYIPVSFHENFLEKGLSVVMEIFMISLLNIP